jgi:hypothetical protein
MPAGGAMTTSRVERAPVAQRPAALVWAVRIVGAGLLLGTAYIHLKLWNDGFRDIAWIGPLFMANVVLGALGALAMLFTPLRWLPWVAILGGLLEIGTLGGLVLSLTVGLFGYHETWGGLVLPSIIVEAAGFLVLFGYGAIEVMRSRQRAPRA